MSHYYDQNCKCEYCGSYVTIFDIETTNDGKRMCDDCMRKYNTLNKLKNKFH